MMINFNTLEELRTKEELVRYFAQRGQSITEEEIGQLKKSYEQAEENSSALTLEQLDEVAGGAKFAFNCFESKYKNCKANGDESGAKRWKRIDSCIAVAIVISADVLLPLASVALLAWISSAADDSNNK